jgi:hypothetical protein
VLNQRVSAINSDIMNRYDISRKRDIKFAITSILLNIFFLLLNAPQTIIYFISKYVIKKSLFTDLYVHFFVSIPYLNHASVFFINLFVNTQFREELLNWFNEKKIFCKKGFNFLLKCFK